MDHKALSSLLIKLAGAFIVINALSDFPKYFAHIMSMRGHGLPLWVPFVGGILPVVIPILVGLGMFMFPSTITNRVIHTSAEQENLIHATPHLEAAAFSVLGVYLLFRAIADATYHFSKFKLYEKLILKEPLYVGAHLMPEEFANLVTTGMEFLLAICLMLGARGLVRLKNRIRGRE